MATTSAIAPNAEQTTIAMNDPIGSDPILIGSSTKVGPLQKSEPLPQKPSLQHSSDLQAVSLLQRVFGTARVGGETETETGTETGTGVGVLEVTGAVVGEADTVPDAQGPLLHPSPQNSEPVPQNPHLLQHCPAAQLHCPELEALPPDGRGVVTGTGTGTGACGVIATGAPPAEG